MHEYTIEIPGLVESVAAVAQPPLSPRAKDKHEALMAAVRGVLVAALPARTDSSYRLIMLPG